MDYCIQYTKPTKQRCKNTNKIQQTRLFADASYIIIAKSLPKKTPVQSLPP